MTYFIITLQNLLVENTKKCYIPIMDFEDFVAQINDDGKRIDKVLRVLIPNS